MEAFSKFGGDLDAATKVVLDKGARNVEILKQAQFAPYSVEKQVAMIYLGTNGLLREVPVKNVKAFEEAFLNEMEVRLPEVLGEFKKGNLPEDGVKRMVTLVNELKPRFA
jgi:F-type H+-transporting ATPase subunit alpha